MTASYDVAVIGAGSGGLTVAAAAAQFGERVVLFEKAEMGGDCLNYGCVPSKAMLAAARQAHAMRQAGRYGISPQEPVVHFAQVVAHVRRAIAAIAPNDSQERFEKLGVKVVRAEARFRDAETLEAGDETFRARRIVVASGSRAALPPISGLADVAHFTNETIFENTELPRHLIIIGAGPIGVEMAQAHRRFGSQVTIIEAFDPLAKDDPELAEIVLQRLSAEGITILARTAIAEVSQTADGIAVETREKGTVTGSHLLVAAGRRPNIEALDLDAAGIAYTSKGITVDDGLRTSNKRVYAVGDVAGRMQFTHVAGYQAGLVVRNALFGLPVKANAVIPWVTYTDPELAHAGLTEADARKAHGDRVKVLRWPFHDNDRAQAEGRTDGQVKIVTARRGRILGASIVGAEAGELILPWVLAMSKGLGIGAMAQLIAPYPTRSDASRRAAISYFSEFPSNPWVRRAISLVKTLRP